LSSFGSGGEVSSEKSSKASKAQFNALGASKAQFNAPARFTKNEGLFYY
jgi:hypothetical protein